MYRPIRLYLRLLAVLAAAAATIPGAAAPGDGAQERTADAVALRMTTSAGAIDIEVYPDKAPVTAANFLRLVDAGFYTGLIFHRVVAGFVIQTGGFDPAMQPREDPRTVVNESGNGLRNRKGTLAMARLSDPDSASTQFFINVANNTHLDGTRRKAGYTVFGRVTSGWEVVEAIELTDTRRVNGMAGVPEQPIVIESIERLPSAG
jgi:cyclophilin family peptidyl-prolyl cis-trans isomerase